MPTTLYSCALQGLNCELIEVETHLSQGLPAFHIVGLADTAIHESKERVRSALLNSGFKFPIHRKTINLAPAYVRKQGPLFDLPIALGVLIESKQITIKDLKTSLFIGELALDGRLKNAQGILVITDFAKRKGFKKIYLPSSNQKEAQIINGISVIGVGNLNNFHKPDLYLKSQNIKPIHVSQKENHQYDFSLVQGQKYAKHALEIAAAGRHHLLMCGPPGCGKTLLARSFQSIQLDLSLKEQIEVSRIYSVLGLLTKNQPLVTNRPFQEVHHTASAVSIIGGGSNPKPGAISLAHKGTLFLDEIAEFPRKVLDVLRQPLENQYIKINRASGAWHYPAAFQLIAAMNPCPCGYHQHSQKECKCSVSEIQNYQKRLSGPLRDRIDIVIQMQATKLSKQEKSETSSQIKKRIKIAQKIQNERYKEENYTNNAELTLKGIKKYIKLNSQAENTLKTATQKLDLSMRSYNRILKLSQTIADLNQSSTIKEKHITEAISYRT